MRHVAEPLEGTDRFERWLSDPTRSAVCCECRRRIIDRGEGWTHARSSRRRGIVALAIAATCIGLGVLVGVLLADPTIEHLGVAVVLTAACVIAVVIGGPRVTRE